MRKKKKVISREDIKRKGGGMEEEKGGRERRSAGARKQSNGEGIHQRRGRKEKYFVLGYPLSWGGKGEGIEKIEKIFGETSALLKKTLN